MAFQMDHRKQRFLDWLCTIEEDRVPRTMKELAEELGVNSNTLGAWKNRDVEFQRAWEAQYHRTVGNPERAQRVLETLYETATDRTDPRQVPAAKQYLEAIGAIKPKQLDVNVKPGAAKDFSDETLLAILAERAAKEIEERQVADDAH